MPKKCSVCRTRVPGEIAYDVSFDAKWNDRVETRREKRKLPLVIPVKNASTCLTCAQKAIEKVVSQYSFGMLVPSDAPRGFDIDWVFVRNQRRREDIAEVLRYLGVLTHRLEGNWIILDGNLCACLSPMHGPLRLCFLLEDDVRQYAWRHFEHIGYKIMQMSNVTQTAARPA